MFFVSDIKQEALGNTIKTTKQLTEVGERPPSKRIGVGGGWMVVTSEGEDGRFWLQDLRR